MVDGVDMSTLQQERFLIRSIGKHLRGLGNRPTSKSATLHDNLSRFVESLSSIHISHIVEDVRKVWILLCKAGYVTSLAKPVPRGKTCLYELFLNNCFLNLNEPESCQLMTQMIVDSGDPCLLHLVSQRDTKTLHAVLDFLFMHLITPSSSKSHIAAGMLLKSCGWKIADSIREMLNGALVSDNEEDREFSSSQYVYEVIFQLVSCSKDLVVGLINNTELCLTTGRKDCEDGLEFFCKLFGAQMIPDAAIFYSHLWNEFLSQRTSLFEPTQLAILAKYTPDMLSQPNSHKGWCSLLFFLLGHVLTPECEKAFVSAITAAVKRNLWLLNDKGPKSVAQLIKNFLTPHCPYERFGDVRDLLMRELGLIYVETAKPGANNMNLQTFNDASSWLISCFVCTCSSLAPSQERWTTLRKVFVKYLVPHHFDAEERMEMLLYLWIHSSFDDWTNFHELFDRTNWARSRFTHILCVLKNKNTSALSKRTLISNFLRQLKRVLISEKSGNFLATKFMPALLSSPPLLSKLYKLLSVTSSCADNYETCIHFKTLLTCEKGMNETILDGLLFYITELTSDSISIKHLVTLVDSCVMGNKISTALGKNRLHIARTALRLLNEVLFMLPHLAFDSNILKVIIKWSGLLNGSLSKLALRCLACLALHQRLGVWSHEFTEKQMLPLLFRIIKSESRGQVKMAMKCVVSHCENSRIEVLQQDIFYIISDQFGDTSKQDKFERGVSALGHFSVYCSSFLKNEVNKCCVSVLLQNMIGSLLMQEESGANSVVSESCSNNTWVDWDELPYHVSIQVQALRSIGRCLRYCGNLSSVSKALETLQAVISMPKERLSQESEVYGDHIRYEAASAILYILEAVEFQSMISKQLLLSLSHVLMDLRIEVRIHFAEKLCQGLSPYKLRSGNIGRSRGNLPPCMLGLLALLGSKLWTSNEETREKAEILVKQVCVSRYLAVMEKCSLLKLSLQDYYSQKPHLVLENTLAAAVPILAEQPMSQTCDFADDTNLFEESNDSLLEIAHCLKFLCSMMCHENPYGAQVTRQYIRNMADTAKQILFSSIKSSQKKIYAVVLQLLELTLKHYRTREKEPITPMVQLPHPFFTEAVQEVEPLESEEILLSVAQLKKIEKILNYARKKKPNSDIYSDDEDQDFEETQSLIDEDNLSSSMDYETSAVASESPQSSSPHDEDIRSVGQDYGLSRSSYTTAFGMPAVHSTPQVPTQSRK